MKSLECQICFHEFDEWRRRPRILSCGHTFCSICLISLLKDGKIACPNCQKYHLAENVENININFTLEGLLSPDDTSKTVEFDTGFKCKEHYYEQNFFCQTHTEWVCRDCIVIKHKPCSHSENCDNKNDCKVITKTERLDLIKTDKISDLKVKSEKYGAELLLHINEYDSKLKSNLTHRKDLQHRLREFTEENDFEIEVLNKKLNSSKDILSNVQKQRNLAKLAQEEIKKAHGRIVVEESCRNVDKIITSAHEWAVKEKCNILEDKKCIADVEITLKEFESLKHKLCETENVLFEFRNVSKHLNCTIAEQKSTNYHLQTQLKEKKELNIELQNNLAAAIEQSSVDNGVFNEKIAELEKELENSKAWADYFKKTMMQNGRKCQMCTNTGEVEAKELNEVKQHLLHRQDDAYLIAKVFNENGISEIIYGQLKLYTYEMKTLVLLNAFEKYQSPGSLLLQCRPMVSNLEAAEYVYLDIGKMEIVNNCRNLIGKPFGRLYIKLNTSRRRKEQMIRIFSSVHSEELKYCNFNVIRNKDRPGELVTCKYYQKVKGLNSQGNEDIEICEFLYGDLEKSDEEHPIDAGNVFGYLDGASGFSIITRNNFSRDTRWPLLGKVVSGLHYLKEAVNDNDVETIGIHSHGIGFSTRGERLPI